MIISDFRPTSTPQKREFLLTPHQKMLLHPLGDIHYGSRHWPERRFKADIAWCCERGIYFLGMGEYLDFTSTSQRKVLRTLREDGIETLDDRIRCQVEEVGALLAPTKGRWLGLLEGDHYHEYADGTTTDQHLCRLLDAPFLGTSTLLRVRLSATGRNDTGCDITVFAHHGLGGGRLAGSGLHLLERMIVGVEADIYLMGHNHAKVSAPLDRLYCTAAGHLYHRRKVFARTGGWLVGYAGQGPRDLKDRAALSRGTYVEARALTPSALGGLIFSLGYKREVRTERGRVIHDVTIPDIHWSI